MAVKRYLWPSYICMNNKPLLPFQRKSYFSYRIKCSLLKHYRTLGDRELPLGFCIEQQITGVTLVSNSDWVNILTAESSGRKANVQGNK